MTPVGITSVIAGKILGVADLALVMSQLAWFIVTIVIGVFFYQLVIMQLIYLAFVRKNPFKFYTGLAQGTLTAFAMSSTWVVDLRTQPDLQSTHIAYLTWPRSSSSFSFWFFYPVDRDSLPSGLLPTEFVVPFIFILHRVDYVCRSFEETARRSRLEITGRRMRLNRLIETICFSQPRGGIARP